MLLLLCDYGPVGSDTKPSLLWLEKRSRFGFYIPGSAGICPDVLLKTSSIFTLTCDHLLNFSTREAAHKDAIFIRYDTNCRNVNIICMTRTNVRICRNVKMPTFYSGDGAAIPHKHKAYKVVTPNKAPVCINTHMNAEQNYAGMHLL